MNSSQQQKFGVKSQITLHAHCIKETLNKNLLDCHCEKYNKLKDSFHSSMVWVQIMGLSLFNWNKVHNAHLENGVCICWVVGIDSTFHYRCLHTFSFF